ncbi:MAG: transglutaminase domain-containing protein [Clostridia bacterium]|nr:transglutaminase domain-containing protein [Clostridia bacterium]
MRRICTLFLLALLLAGLLPFGAGAEPLWPAAGGTEQRSGKMKLDVSFLTEGYFLAAIQSPSSHRLKLRVTKDGETLTYDLNSNGDYEVFPLQLGNGNYEVSLYENVTGKKYSQEGKISLNVRTRLPGVCFLYPNQYVNYNQFSEAVAKAGELCAGKSPKEAYAIICDFIRDNFVYDFIKAVTVQAGQLPEIDKSYANRMGVCQDLSAITVCMLRTQGIPSRLIIGYADNQYHAWTMTRLGGSEDEFFDPTAALNAITQVKDYSMERYY